MKCTVVFEYKGNGDLAYHPYGPVDIVADGVALAQTGARIEFTCLSEELFARILLLDNALLVETTDCDNGGIRQEYRELSIIGMSTMLDDGTRHVEVIREADSYEVV